MMTRKEERDEFWMLTQGILQDSKVETSEARVVKRWLEEHRRGGEFDFALARLGEQLADNWIDRFESQAIVETIGRVLQILRTEADREA